MDDKWTALLEKAGPALSKKDIDMTPQELLEAAIDYFRWAEESPLWQAQVNVFQGEVTEYSVAKVRAFLLPAMATHMGVTERMLTSTLKKPEFENVAGYIHQIIYAHKYENAAAGLLNSSIVQRDLGLTEKTEISGTEGGAPVTFNINPVAPGTFLSPEEAPRDEG